MSNLVDIDEFKKYRILVVGDIMLDRYFWGEVVRISPEAPVPVFKIKRRSDTSGGAGNVVFNLVGLGGCVTIIGICGNDIAGDRLLKILNIKKVQTHILKDSERPTITKTRIVSGGQQLLRLDEEEGKPLNPSIKIKVLDLINSILPRCNAVILSDYGKGFLQTPKLSQSIISLAKKKSIPLLVDPKGEDWKRYRGSTCITPNIKELETVIGKKIDNKKMMIETMQSIKNRFELDWLVVTRGSLGLCIMGKDKKPLFVPALAKEVYDVSGAGDTVISTLALGVASGLSFPEAAGLANIAAGIVVGKVGTQPINKFELKASISIDGKHFLGRYQNKIASLSAAELQVQAWRANGDKVVFTNGCFDLLHPGHIHLLNNAKDLGDRLIIGLNSDESVRRLKGPVRPILNENDRAALLASLNSIDLVCIFDQDTPNELITKLKPDILVKGSDYRPEEVAGREIVASYGGKIELMPTLDGYSTTNITNKVLKNTK